MQNRIRFSFFLLNFETKKEKIVYTLPIQYKKGSFTENKKWNYLSNSTFNNKDIKTIQRIVDFIINSILWCNVNEIGLINFFMYHYFPGRI